MEAFVQRQVRCAACNRRLADVISEIDAGQVIFEVKCPRCGHSHLEIFRAPGTTQQAALVAPPETLRQIGSRRSRRAAEPVQDPRAG